MHFLYQIVTSLFIYTLYEEEEEIFLHVLNLRAGESTDVFGVTKIMDTLNEDPEVAFEDIIEVDDIITTVLSSDSSYAQYCASLQPKEA